MPTDLTSSPDIALHTNLVRRLIQGCERQHLRTENSVEITDALILDALRQEGMVPSRAAGRIRCAHCGLILTASRKERGK